MQSSKETGIRPGRSGRRQPFLALREHDYRLMWQGQAISQLGTQMRNAAIGWQLYILTHDPLQLGIISLCRIVPMIVFTLIGGPLADSTDRRKLLLWTEIIEVICSAALAVVTLSGLANVWWIYGLTVLSSATSSFERPAFSALLPSLVPRELLTSAISLNTVNFLAATIAGPGLGGLVIAVGGVQAVYFLDALSYLAVVSALLRIRFRPVNRPTTRVSIEAAVEGLRFVWNNKTLVSSMLLDLLATFFAWGTTLLPVVASDVLHTNEVGFGLLGAAQAAGALVVNVVMAWIEPDRLRQPGKLMLIAVFFFGLFTLLFGLSTWLPLSLLCLALVGASDSFAMVLRQTIIQLATPDEMRGRIQSVNMLIFGGGPQLGEVEAGLVARLAGTPAAIISGGIACMLMVIGFSSSSQLRHYEFPKETATNSNA